MVLLSPPRGDLQSSAHTSGANDRRRWINGSKWPVDAYGPHDRPFNAFSPALLTVPIIDTMAAVARQRPAATAIFDGQTGLTYQATWTAAMRLARAIAATTNPGDLVGILLPSGVSFPVAMLACLAAGRPFLPMDLHYPRRWIEQVIEDAGLTAVIGMSDDHSVDDLLPPTLTLIDIKPAFDPESEPLGTVGLTPLGPDEPAMVLYTSGSSGRPKGIVNSQRNLLRRVEQYVNAAHLSIEDRFLPLSSDCTIAGIRERLAALLSGATLHQIDVQRSSARQIDSILREHEITVIYAVPALLRSLVQLADGPAPDSLRLVRVGGDAVLGSDVEMLRDWLAPSCLIELGYSSTEAPIMQWFIPPDFPTESGKLPIGYPLSGNELAIVDHDDQPVAAGEIGELLVRSPFVALGRMIGGDCVGDDFPVDATADPARGEARVLSTGDMVRVRPDGLIELIGRKDRQIKIRGQRVEPGEVEAAILRWADVTDTAVIGRQDAEWTTLIAYVAARDGAPHTLLGELKAHLREVLPPPLRPREIYLLPAIPRLPSAKLDLTALRAVDAEIARDEAANRGPLAPVAIEDELEGRVAGIWRQVLKRRDIGRHANFFDLGGDSLSVIHMMFEIEKALGVELPVTMIYQTPTVASLTAAIRARDEANFSPLVLVKDGHGATALFIVHGIGGNVMELFSLCRHIDHPGPVYAIQARGLDGRDAPNRSVAAMAEDYWSAIRALQPSGPYYLGGYSFGGSVAFEMACRITAEGGDVGFLALLDTATNARQWPRHIWLRWLAGRALQHLRTLLSLPPRQWTRHVRRTAASLRLSMRWRLGLAALEDNSFVVAGIPKALAAVRLSNLAASAAYRPGLYSGAVTLIVSTLGASTMCNPNEIWRRRAPIVTVHRAPGNHVNMVEAANGREVARIISTALRQSTRATPSAAVRPQLERAPGGTGFAGQAPA